MSEQYVGDTDLLFIPYLQGLNNTEVSTTQWQEILNKVVLKGEAIESTCANL